MLSDQLLKKKRLGYEIRLRGMSGGIRIKNKSNYSVTLYELLKAYSAHVMKKNFMSINIPKLPLCTTEEAIKIIKKNINKLSDWSQIFELIPKRFLSTKKLARSGKAGLFTASLELTKEGLINILQKEHFKKILIRHKR